MSTKKENIIKTASILFATKGIRNTKVEDIANELGIARGGLYYYFKSKEELLEYIIEDSLKNRKEFLKDLDVKNLNFEKKIKELIRRRIALGKDRYHLFLFAKIYENGEISLTKDEYYKKDLFFMEILEKNKTLLKEEYQNKIFMLSSLVTTSLTKFLLLLIENTSIQVKDEKSYQELLENFQKIDLDKEIDFFYNLYFKEILK